MSDRSNTGSYSQTALLGDRRTSSQCQCSRCSPLPSRCRGKQHPRAAARSPRGACMHQAGRDGHSQQQLLVITVLNGQYLLNLSRCLDPEKEPHTVAQPLHEGSPIFLKAKIKDFCFSPLRWPFPQRDTYLAEHWHGAGNCPGCTSPSYRSAQRIQVLWK